MSIWVVELGCKAKIISNTGPAAWWLCPDVCCLSAHVSLLSSPPSMFGLTCQTCHSDLQPELAKAHQSPKYSKVFQISASQIYKHQLTSLTSDFCSLLRRSRPRAESLQS